MPVETKPAINSGYLFRELSARLKKDPTLQQRVVAHVREVSGHNTLPAFVNNGSSEEEKCEVLATCLKAIISGDYSALKGGVSKGQAPAPEPPPNAPTETTTATKVKSFKVGCKDDKNCKTWTYNGLRFFMADEAKLYGQDLYSRWMGLAAWEVHECEEDPIHHFEDNRVIYPKEPEKPVEVTPATTETATTPQDEPEPPTTITAPTPPEPTVAPTPEPRPAENQPDPRILAVMEALKGLVAPAQPIQPVSTHLEEHINALVASAVKEMQTKLEQYIQGAVEERVRQAVEKAIAAQIHEEVKAAKFELVQAIETGHYTSLKTIAKAIAEAV